MGGMFANCSSLVSLNLSSFDTSNVNSFYSGVLGMFGDCGKLTNINYGNNFVCKKGAMTTNMFSGCPASGRLYFNLSQMCTICNFFSFLLE